MHNKLKLLPAVTFGLLAATISAGIVLSIPLLVLGDINSLTAQLAVFILTAGWIISVWTANRLKPGRSITKQDTRIMGSVTVAITWLAAFYAIVASPRYLNAGAVWEVHLAVELSLLALLPLALRPLNSWYAKVFWARRVADALAATGQKPDIEAAAKNYALPETMAWAIAAAWILGATLGNIPSAAAWDNGTIYSVAIAAATTFAATYYHSHPDQRRLRRLIKAQTTAGQDGV